MPARRSITPVGDRRFGSSSSCRASAARLSSRTVRTRSATVQSLESPPMFTVEQRDALREHVLRLARDDERVVSGAVVGSLAVDGGGDRFSDLDLTFAVADHVPVAEVLDDWTGTLAEQEQALQLTDLARSDRLPRLPPPQRVAVRPLAHPRRGLFPAR